MHDERILKEGWHEPSHPSQSRYPRKTIFLAALGVQSGAITASYFKLSVGRRRFDVVDHSHLHRVLGGNELQTELFVDQREERWTVGIEDRRRA